MALLMIPLSQFLDPNKTTQKHLTRKISPFSAACCLKVLHDTDSLIILILPLRK